MICNKCGKNNENGVGNCAFCGAPMAAVSGHNGFADILRYSAELPAASVQNRDAIAASVRTAADKAAAASAAAGAARVMSLVALIVACTVFVVSLAFNFIAIGTVNKYKDDVQKLQDRVDVLENIDTHKDGDEAEKEDDTADSDAEKEDELDDKDDIKDDEEQSADKKVDVGDRINKDKN